MSEQPTRRFQSIMEIGAAEWLAALKLPAADIPDVVIVEGSWWRAQRTAWRLSHLEEVRELEFPDIFWGRWQGRKVIYCCAYGAPRTVEIIHLFGLLGAQLAVQIGTCGGLQPHLRTGDIILPTTALCREGVAQYYRAPESAAAAPAWVAQAQDWLARQGHTTCTGVHLTWPSLFAQDAALVQGWHEAGYLAVDMETATTLAVSRYFGMAALAMLVVWDDLTRGRSFLDPLSDAELARLDAGNRDVFAAALALAERLPTNASPARDLLRPEQRRLVALAWLVYAAYYLGRVNIATALPALQSTLGLTAAQVGLLGTLFFWVYAVGQLVNGRLGDLVSPRWFVLFGLLGSAGVNLVFGLASPWWLLLALWALNGWLQSAGWGPTLRLLSIWLTPDQRARIATAFGTSFVAGNAFTWLLTGWLVGWYGWRAAFVIPAVLMAVVGLVFWFLTRDAPAAVANRAAPAAGASPFALAAVRRAGPALLAAVATGFCYAALLLWAPAYFVTVAGLPIGNAATLAALLPVVGIGGTLLAGWVNNRLGRGREGLLTAAVLLLCAVLFLATAAAGGQLVLATSALLLASGAANAATSLVLSAWPLVLGSSRTTSSLAGLLGFAFNIGGGLSGSATGLLLDRQGWTAVFGLLALLAVLGAAAALWLQRRQSFKMANAHSTEKHREE